MIVLYCVISYLFYVLFVLYSCVVVRFVLLYAAPVGKNGFADYCEDK